MSKLVFITQGAWSSTAAKDAAMSNIILVARDVSNATLDVK